MESVNTKAIGNNILGASVGYNDFGTSSALKILFNTFIVQSGNKWVNLRLHLLNYIQLSISIKIGN